jgi:hypothetical protein
MVTYGDESREFVESEVDIQDHPGAIVCPIFDEAGVFTGTEFKKRQFRVAIAYPDGFKDRLAKFDGGVLIGGRRPALEDVGRFYAKIAHSFAAAYFGIGAFIPFLTPGIRGEGNLMDLWDFVGGQHPNLPLDDFGGHLHVLMPVAVRSHSGQNVLMIRISLFAAHKLPTWDVVVGFATLATKSPP